MKINKFVKHMLAIEYRLAVISGGRTYNTYGTDRRLLTKMAGNTSGMEYWTLYKKGPFWMPEREVDFGMKGGAK